MKKQLVSLVFLVFSSGACQTSLSSRATPEASVETADVKLWNQYIETEKAAAAGDKACAPRLLRADSSVGRRGLLMFFHGLSGCPDDFQTIGEQLSKAGFDVYLPRLPGQRDKGNDETLDRSHESYKKFLQQMNQIASAAPLGDRVLAGLSAGAAMATEAALLAPQQWDRLLLYAPRATESLNSVRRIKVPLQLVGVKYEPTAEINEVQKAVEGLRNARACFYPEGVPHAMLHTDDASAYWMPALREDSLAFITRGQWFLTAGVLREKYGWSTCRYVL